MLAILQGTCDANPFRVGVEETTAARVLSLCEEMMRWGANVLVFWDGS